MDDFFQWLRNLLEWLAKACERALAVLDIIAPKQIEAPVIKGEVSK